MSDTDKAEPGPIHRTSLLSTEVNADSLKNVLRQIQIVVCILSVLVAVVAVILVSIWYVL